MGMFDRVWARCPKCGAPNELQSKGGGCHLDDYTLDEAPVEVLADIDRVIWCVDCNTKLEIIVPKPTPYVIPWHPKPWLEEGE